MLFLLSLALWLPISPKKASQTSSHTTSVTLCTWAATNEIATLLFFNPLDQSFDDILIPPPP